MNTYRTAYSSDQKNYRKLRRYWKLFLKEENELDYQTYHYQRLFKKWMTEIDMMDYLLTLNNQLTDTYKFYQESLHKN